jgi:hypothetical protein
MLKGYTTNKIREGEVFHSRETKWFSFCPTVLKFERGCGTLCLLLGAHPLVAWTPAFGWDGMSHIFGGTALHAQVIGPPMCITQANRSNAAWFLCVLVFGHQAAAARRYRGLSVAGSSSATHQK